MVKGNTDWLQREERDAPEEILGSRKEPSHATSGRGPVLPGSAGRSTSPGGSGAAATAVAGSGPGARTGAEEAAKGAGRRE